MDTKGIEVLKFLNAQGMKGSEIKDQKVMVRKLKFKICSIGT